MKNFFQNKKKQLYEWIDGLTNKQRLIYSIIFVLILIFLVNVVFGKILKGNQSIIGYEKNMSGKDLYMYSYNIDGNDSFIQVKNAIDSFIDLCEEKKYDNKGKKIKLNDVYNEALYSEYRDFISKSKFKNTVKEVLNAVEKIKMNNNNKLNPTNVKQYQEKIYIAKYSYKKENDEDGNLWLGVALDSTSGLYYIWYMEVE